MLKKLLLCVFVAVISVAPMTGCAGKKEEPALAPVPKTESQSAPEPEAAADLMVQNMDNARIVLGLQEYIGDNIAEIPYIEYDGETNPEIDSINRGINQGIRQIYEDIKNAEGDKGWIEIRSYLFTSEDYLQAVVWYCQYPIYGTDGNMFSINYDRKAGKSLLVNDMLSELGMNQSDIEKEVSQLLQLQKPDVPITEFSTTGFLVNKNNITLLLEIRLEDSEEDSWKYLYSYTPELGELHLLDNDRLFDPLETDPIDKPTNKLTISAEDGYNLRVNYFSNTFISGDYPDEEKTLGYFDVENSDSFYDAIFECIGDMDIVLSDMSVGSIPSGIGEFLLMADDEKNPNYEVFFYDDDYTVFFHGMMEYDSAVYVAKPDSATYYRLKELIGELRLGTQDFEWTYEYNIYDTLNMPILYSVFMMELGNHYAPVDETLNIIDADIEKVDDLLSSINISDRSGSYPSELGKHMQITDAEGSVIAWIYFDTEQSKLFIYPAAEAPPANLFGAYSITTDTLHYAEELLEYLQK